MHILVDMDDTIVQWGAAKDRELRARYPHLPNFLFGELQTGWDMNEGLDEEHRAALLELMNSEGFYANMEPVLGAATALNNMLEAGHEVTIVSTPWAKNPTCLRDKYEWLEKHIGPGWGDRAIFTRDKTAIRGDVLFDDKPVIKGKYEPTWTHVIVDQPHNRYIDKGCIRIGNIHGWSWALSIIENGPVDLYPLIGIGGVKESGKDEFADALVDYFRATKMGMSDPLIAALEALNPLVPLTESHEWIRVAELVKRVGYVAAKQNSEVRTLLQRLGTEVGRNMLGEDVWVDLAAKRITKARKYAPVVITGVRFPNEVAMIERLGGERVYVRRPGYEASGHVSETSVTADDFETIIENDRDLGGLYARAAAFGDDRGWY